MFDRSRASTGDVSSPLSCYFLWRSLIVTSRGSVTRCPIHHNSAHYGSLKTHSVQELYQSEATCRARSLFRPARPEAEQHSSVDAELDALLSFGEKNETEWYPMPCASCAFFKRECGGPNRDKMTNVIQGRRELPMF